MPPDLFFMPAATGQRLCVLHRAQVEPRGAILYVHPFAEEMNKTRRMAALTSSRLAAAGYTVLQIDLLGCGDSTGDFEDATWDAWLDDLGLAARWLREAYPAPFWWWGMRTGALLVANAKAAHRADDNYLFWQPTTRGNAFLQQFRRLQTVSAALTRPVSAGANESAQGTGSIEVAGYMLAPALMRGLDAAELAPPPTGNRLRWLELVSRDGIPLGAASNRCIDEWRNAGFETRTAAVPGLKFWQTTEVEIVPQCIDATLALLAPPAA